MAKHEIRLKLNQLYAIKHALQKQIESRKKNNENIRDIVQEEKLLEKIIREIDEIKERYRIGGNK